MPERPEDFVSPNPYQSPSTNVPHHSPRARPWQAYPKRPIRAVGIMFLGVWTFFLITLPFHEAAPPQSWPWFFTYFALLPATLVGIMRVGPRAFFLLAAFGVVAMAIGGAGFLFTMRSSSLLHSVDIWLRVSLYLYYALGMAAIALAAKGWVLYWKHKIQ